MKFKKASIIFLMMMSGGIFACLTAFGGWYPVALVNYHVITEQAVEKNAEVIYDFSKNVATLSGTDTGKLDSPEFSREIKLKVLDDLVSRELIFQELKKRVGISEATAIAEKNITQALNGKTDTGEGVEKLYGLSLADFKDRVLLPQAYQEILSGRMTLNSEDFAVWLGNARKTGSVLIFYPGFSWDGEKVIAK